jgi:hypothetical protein
MNDIPNPEDLRPAGEFVEQNPHLFPTKSSWPWQLRNRDTNGLRDAGAVLMINGKAYINVPRYMAAMAAKVA